MSAAGNAQGYTVAGAVCPDGSLFDTGWYLFWMPGNDEATLDGYFTARQLREIADHMDAEMKSRSDRHA